MPKTPLLDIRLDQWDIVQGILQKHVPQCEVWAFGSRATWKAKEYSDLDLAIISDKPMSLDISANLSDDFSESDLPWKVDVVDWATTSASFRKIIERDKVVVQRRKKSLGVATKWQTVRLTDLGELNRGKSRYRPRNASHLYGGPYPFVQTGDIRASNGFITKHSQTYSEAGLAQSRLWPKDTLAITIAANIAESALLTYPACFPDSVVGFVADSKKCDIRFVDYLFRNKRYELQNEHVGTGSVQDNINLEILGKIEFKVPPLPEQRAIAHILGTLDDKIELNRRRNQTLEAMARALFKDWFVDFGPVRAKMEGREAYLPADLWQRFPDRLDDEGKPEGWSERPLDEIADFLNGIAMQKFPATDADDSLPVIKIAELRNGISAKSDRASRDLPAKYVIKDGDFLFSWSGSLLAKFWTEGEGALNQHLFKVTSASYPMWFVSHWVHHHLEEFQAIAASKATTMGHIQRGHLKAAMTLCPPDDVLERLGGVMAPLVDQSIHNELESRQLAQLRDTLLPKLISGELRIVDAEKIVEAAQ